MTRGEARTTILGMASDPDIVWPDLSALAVLCSGGVDSALMLVESLRHYPAVHPIYIRAGSAWEETESRYLERFLNAVRTSARSRAAWCAPRVFRGSAPSAERHAPMSPS